MFNSYVKLPEGILSSNQQKTWAQEANHQIRNVAEERFQACLRWASEDFQLPHEVEVSNSHVAIRSNSLD